MKKFNLSERASQTLRRAPRVCLSLKLTDIRCTNLIWIDSGTWYNDRATSRNQFFGQCHSMGNIRCVCGTQRLLEEPKEQTTGITLLYLACVLLRSNMHGNCISWASWMRTRPLNHQQPKSKPQWHILSVLLTSTRQPLSLVCTTLHTRNCFHHLYCVISYHLTNHWVRSCVRLLVH